MISYRISLNQTHHAPFIGGHSVFYPANEDIQSIRCNSVASSAGSLAMNDLETAWFQIQPLLLRAESFYKCKSLCQKIHSQVTGEGKEQKTQLIRFLLNRLFFFFFSLISKFNVKWQHWPQHRLTARIDYMKYICALWVCKVKPTQMCLKPAFVLMTSRGHMSECM